MNVSLYCFEDADGNRDTYQTFNAIKTQEYARENGMLAIEQVFEFEEETPVEEWDYRPKPEQEEADAV